jgi:glycosyltransferase involved in cell wall biosynthesis
MERGALLVSVIIPAFNAEAFLQEAIESVLAQDYSPFELIVVDDGSTDSSGKIAESYPQVRCIRLSHGGVSAARNAGIAAAQGEFIAFLDADDIWMPHKLTVQVGYLCAHPEVGFAFAYQRFIFEQGIEAPPWFPQKLLTQDSPGFLPSTLIVRKEVFECAGGFSTSLRRGEDTEWLLRARDCGIQMGIVKETLLLRRAHSGNVSLMKPSDYRLLLSLLKQSIDRRKENACE